MSDAAKTPDEKTESSSKNGESSEKVRESSEAPEDKESIELKGILKNVDEASPVETRESSKDSSKSSAIDDESKKKFIEEFKIPDDLKTPKKSESLQDDPFAIASLKTSKEDHKPARGQTSKELADPGLKEDSKDTPKQKESAPDERQDPVKSESKDDYSKETSGTSQKRSEEQPSESESTDDYSEEHPKTDEKVKEFKVVVPGAARKRRPSFSEQVKKKQTSIVKFFTRSKSKRKDESGTGKPKPRRSSFIMRKFIGLEKELTTDSINRKVTRIFQPDVPPDKDAEKAKEAEEADEEEDPEPKRVYLSSAMACMLIVSGMTGSAMSSLPFYLGQSSKFLF